MFTYRTERMDMFTLSLKLLLIFQLHFLKQIVSILMKTKRFDKYLKKYLRKNREIDIKEFRKLFHYR
jgi:hypothetical protein